MNKASLSVLLIAFICLCCSRKIISPNGEYISKKDSLVLEDYKYQVMREYSEDSTLTKAELDTLWATEYQSGHFQNTGVKYSPDGKLKIYFIEVESCGAYCNSEWYSWAHFKKGRKEFRNKTTFSMVDTIIKLPNNKYLIIDEYGGRPASVLTVQCKDASLVSLGDSLMVHKIEYLKKHYFGYCQENGVELENDSPPYIKYENGLLKYYYGNNFAYSDGVDIDTIHAGQFRYVNGEFVLEKETITVKNRENIGK